MTEVKIQAGSTVPCDEREIRVNKVSVKILQSVENSTRRKV